MNECMNECHQQEWKPGSWKQVELVRMNVWEWILGSKELTM